MSTHPRWFHPDRPLGRTGVVVTALGIGDLADPELPEDVLVATLHRAMDAGLVVIDTAPSYGDGLGERVVGAALRGRREGMFVIDKIDELEQPVAPQIEASLERLGLGRIDLVAFHDLSTVAAWKSIAAPGGGLDQLEACRDAGRVRFLGLSSHHPDVLDLAIRSGRCDAVMLPVGPWVDPRYVEEILPLALDRGVGTIGFKAFGAGKLVADTTGYGRPLPPGPGLPRLSVEECVRYVLTVGADVQLLGLSTPAEQDAAFAAARAFRPMDPAEMRDVRRRAAHAIEGKGACWWNPAEATTR